MSKESPDYKRALVTLEGFDQLAVGFHTWSEGQGVLTTLKDVIKQNNTIIELILQIHQRLKQIEAKEPVPVPSPPGSHEIENLISQLSNLYHYFRRKEDPGAKESIILRP